MNSPMGAKMAVERDTVGHALDRLDETRDALRHVFDELRSRLRPVSTPQPEAEDMPSPCIRDAGCEVRHRIEDVATSLRELTARIQAQLEALEL